MSATEVVDCRLCGAKVFATVWRTPVLDAKGIVHGWARNRARLVPHYAACGRWCESNLPKKLDPGTTATHGRYCRACEAPRLPGT